MDNQPKIRVTKEQIKELKKLQESKVSGSYTDVLEYLLEYSKKVERLENIIKTIHFKTKI